MLIWEVLLTVIAPYPRDTLHETKHLRLIQTDFVAPLLNWPQQTLFFSQVVNSVFNTYFDMLWSQVAPLFIALMLNAFKCKTLKCVAANKGTPKKKHV